MCVAGEAVVSARGAQLGAVLGSVGVVGAVAALVVADDLDDGKQRSGHLAQSSRDLPFERVDTLAVLAHVCDVASVPGRIAMMRSYTLFTSGLVPVAHRVLDGVLLQSARVRIPAGDG